MASLRSGTGERSHRHARLFLLGVPLVLVAMFGVGCGAATPPAAPPVNEDSAPADPIGAAPKPLPAPQPLAADTELQAGLADAAAVYLAAHAEQGDPDRLDGPIVGSSDAARQGPWQYAIASFETGRTLDESVHFYRHERDDAWTAARWIVAGDITALCVLPSPLARLWVPDLAAASGCVNEPAARAGELLLRSYDGGLVCRGSSQLFACWSEGGSPPEAPAAIVDWRDDGEVRATADPAAADAERFTAVDDRLELRIPTLVWGDATTFTDPGGEPDASATYCTPLPDVLACSRAGQVGGVLIRIAGGDELDVSVDDTTRDHESLVDLAAGSEADE